MLTIIPHDRTRRIIPPQELLQHSEAALGYSLRCAAVRHVSRAVLSQNRAV